MDDIFNWIMPIVGVIVGAFASYFAQKNLYKEQIEEERLRQRNQFLVQKLEIYSRILKASYDNVMINEIGGGRVEFDVIKYREIFRPLFYEKFYLLDNEVSDVVKEIDRHVIEAYFYGSNEYLNYDLINLSFNKIMDFIESNLQETKNKIHMEK